MVYSVVRDSDTGAGGDVCVVNGETARLDFAGEEAGDAWGDTHGFIDARFEIARLGEERPGADRFESGEGGVEVVDQS